MRRGGFLVEFFVGFGAAVKICGAIAGDGSEPPGETGDFAEHTEPRQGLEEDVLHEIVNIGEGNAGKQNAVDHAGVTSVKETKCGAVASLGGANEGVVGAASLVWKTHGRRTGAGRAEFRECGHVAFIEIRSVSRWRRR